MLFDNDTFTLGTMLLAGNLKYFFYHNVTLQFFDLHLAYTVVDTRKSSTIDGPAANYDTTRPRIHTKIIETKLDMFSHLSLYCP